MCLATDAYAKVCISSLPERCSAAIQTWKKNGTRISPLVQCNWRTDELKQLQLEDGLFARQHVVRINGEVLALHL
jgi:hypothetical protein